MKKTTFILSALLFSAFMALPASADSNGHNRGYGNSNHSGVDQRNIHPNTARGRYDIHGNYYKDKDRRHHRDYEYRHPKQRPHGYRPEPYDRRYPHPRVWKNRPYHYEGHWDSWADWDRYAKRHPDRYRHGRYIREGGHLLFRFYDPMGGGYLFFSIGK
jgi:hypothetical protein